MDISDWRSPACAFLPCLHHPLQEKQVRASLPAARSSPGLRVSAEGTQYGRDEPEGQHEASKATFIPARGPRSGAAGPLLSVTVTTSLLCLLEDREDVQPQSECCDPAGQWLDLH